MSNRFTASGSNAANRRKFLKCGVGACVAGAMIHPISLANPVIPFYKAVFDERFEDASAFAAEAAARRIPAVAIRGDVTKLFYEDLDLRWKQGPIRLAGITTPASLFCLDLLARDRGMRVSHCVDRPSLVAARRALDSAMLPCSPAPSGGPSDLVFWIIEPVVRASAKEASHA